MKKVIKMLIVAVCSASLILCSAGCDKKIATTNPKEKTVVTVWTGQGHSKAFLAQKIADWNKTEGERLGITIEYTVQDNIDTKIDLAYETDQAPDLFTYSNLLSYVEKGNIIPFEDIPGTEDLIKKYDEYCMYARTNGADGKHYSLPKTATTYGIVYNKDMFKKAGIVDGKGEAKPPETIEEYVECAKKLTNVSKKEFGIIFPAKTQGWYGNDVSKLASASTGFCDNYDPKSGTFVADAEIEIMKAVMDIKNSGSYFPGAEGLDNDQARARFGAGGVGMKTAGSYDFGVFTTQYPATIDWGVAPFPTLKKGERKKQIMGAYSYLFINKKCAEKADKILPVLEFFYSDDLIIDAYKEGIDIPVKWDLVKDIKLDKKMDQWRQFAELADISTTTPMPIRTKLETPTNLSQMWAEDIWTEKIARNDIEDTIHKFIKEMNDGIAIFQQQNPDYDPSLCIYPDWDSTIK